MYKLITLAAACLVSISANAAEVLKIFFNSNQSLPLYQIESLVHTSYDTNFYVLAKDGAIYGPLTDARFELGEDASVDDLRAHSDPFFTATGSEIILTNLHDGTPINLYTVDGQLLFTAKSTINSCSINIKDYHRPEIYLLNIGTQTYKILLK